MNNFEVNGHPLPLLLIELIQKDKWQQPGDEIMKLVVSCIREPIDFLSVEQMRKESSGVMADFQLSHPWFREVRGSKQNEPVDLPWLDVEKAVFIAVNRYPGDDVGIALDYRTKQDDPRVIASDWSSKTDGCMWKEITPAFSQFIEQINLAKSKS